MLKKQDRRYTDPKARNDEKFRPLWKTVRLGHNISQNATKCYTFCSAVSNPCIK
jgi:hypothetical protein